MQALDDLSDISELSGGRPTTSRVSSTISRDSTRTAASSVTPHQHSRPSLRPSPYANHRKLSSSSGTALSPSLTVLSCLPPLAASAQGVSCVPPLVPSSASDGNNNGSKASSRRQSKQSPLEARTSKQPASGLKAKRLEAVVKMLNVDVERILISPKLVSQLFIKKML